MKKKHFLKFLILRTIGNFLILFTLFGFFATFGPAAYYEVSYRVEKFRGVHYALGEMPKSSFKNSASVSAQIQNQAPSFFAGLTSNSKEKILVPPSTNFSVVIPRIGAAEAVTSNVDPDNETAYLEVLKSTIAHAKGSAFPGLNGRTYIFAHSADNFWNVGRYNAVFYLLKEMENNDEIYVFFQGKKFTYKVYDKKIVESSETQYITSNLGQGEELILQTCWPPGTAWKRLLVFAKPKV